MRGRRVERAEECGIGRGAVITLVLGGARSGKSELAEALAARAAADSGPQPEASVTYVATAVADAQDAEFEARLTAHRARRPSGWRTVELGLGGDLAGALGDAPVVLVDSLGTWLAGFPGFAAPLGELVRALERRRAAGRQTVLVSDEVGLGVHPETSVGREFRDALGDVNRRVAGIATRVLFVVAGRALELGPVSR